SHHQSLPSFPTRRSSDLQPGDVEFADPLVPDPPDRSALAQMRMGHGLVQSENRSARHTFRLQRRNGRIAARKTAEPALDDGLERSEEHTSELQSLAYLVC